MLAAILGGAPAEFITGAGGINDNNNNNIVGRRAKGKARSAQHVASGLLPQWPANDGQTNQFLPSSALILSRSLAGCIRHDDDDDSAAAAADFGWLHFGQPKTTVAGLTMSLMRLVATMGSHPFGHR